MDKFHVDPILSVSQPVLTFIRIKPDEAEEQCMQIISTNVLQHTNTMALSVLFGVTTFLRIFDFKRK